jgi:signal transduction histidine kinase
VRGHVRRTNTAVEAHITTDVADAGHAIKTAAFRFVQEALNNAHRHAGGTIKHVDAYRQNGAVIIKVSDDGKGFDLARPVKDEKLGLAGMRQRIESLGGEFDIKSAIGAGTTLTAKLPLDQMENAARV